MPNNAIRFAATTTTACRSQTRTSISKLPLTLTNATVWYVNALPNSNSITHVHIQRANAQGSVCNVIYDSDFSYYRINKEGEPFPDCPSMDKVAAKAPKRVNAGGKFSYAFTLRNKADFSGLLQSDTYGAEFVVVLPDALTLTSVKVQNPKVTVSRVLGGTTAGANVWKLQTTEDLKTLKKLTIKLGLSVDACKTSGTETISAKFFPLGRDVYNCYYDAETDIRVVGKTWKCDGHGSKRNGKTKYLL